MRALPTRRLSPLAALAAAGLPIALVAALSAASAPNPASQSASAAPQDSSQATSILRTNANLVLVDVVVTDHDNPVHGLPRGSFHVFEDGREQKIVSFDERRPAAASATADLTANKPAPLPPGTYTNAPLYPPSTAVNILLLDGLNTPVADQMNARRQMLRYMASIAPGTPLAIFTLASSLHMVAGFTTNPAALVKVFESSRTAPQPSVVLDPQALQDLDSQVGAMANMTANAPSTSVDGISALSAMQQFETDVSVYQTDQRVVMTLDAMQQLARYLSAVPGRKNLIWFSGSFPISLDPDDSLPEPFQDQRSYSEAIRDTDELLSAARVAVYPVNSRGLMTLPSAEGSYTPSTNMVGAAMTTPRAGSRRGTSNRPRVGADNAKFMQQSMAEEASMQQIAEDTGGREQFDTNDLKQAVADAIANGSSYYTLGYVPASKDFNGAFREIEVRVNDGHEGGYNLEYRNGYYADPPGQATAHNPGNTSLIVAATLHGAPPTTQIVFDARVLPATDPQLAGAKLPAGLTGEMASQLKPPLRRYVVDFNVSPRQLDFVTLPNGVRETQVEFVLVAYNPDGQRTNYIDRGFAFNIQPGQLPAVAAEGIRFRMALDVPAKPGFLRVAVHDLLAARAGSLEVPLRIAAK